MNRREFLRATGVLLATTTLEPIAVASAQGGGGPPAAHLVQFDALVEAAEGVGLEVGTDSGRLRESFGISYVLAESVSPGYYGDVLAALDELTPGDSFTAANSSARVAGLRAALDEPTLEAPRPTQSRRTMDDALAESRRAGRPSPEPSPMFMPEPPEPVTFEQTSGQQRTTWAAYAAIAMVIEADVLAGGRPVPAETLGR